MECNMKAWPLSTLHGLHERIDPSPDYQRPAVWSKQQQQLLIDTILRGYDIPKLYWSQKSPKPVEKWDIIDGQQRVRAIWGFMAGDYSLAKDADPIGEFKIAGVSYKDLPSDLSLSFDQYQLDVIIVSGADDEEVREMFLRLQNGTTLKAQEKRNAMSGQMREFVKTIAGHKFFENCGYDNKRYTFDHVAAQMILLEMHGEPCNVQDRDLNKMYESNKDFDTQCTDAKQVKRTLDFLRKVFPEKTPELTRYSAISLYMIASYLLSNHVIKGREKELRDWFIDFEQYREDRRKLEPDDDLYDEDITIYQKQASYSTDRADSLKWRYEYLMRKLFQAIPDIELLDPKRDFTQEQRIAIYRRDGGRCQIKDKCKGEKCEWGNWHADHVIPHSKGGKTIVSNGQVACSACNLAKSNRKMEAGS